MLVVETIGKIRRAHFVEGTAIKAICRDLGISRQTVRKVIRSGQTSFDYHRERQPLPRIGPWEGRLCALLEENVARPARERLSLIRLFELLREEGYEGSYDAVRRYGRRWEDRHETGRRAAYVPLSFAPGEAYQFDWSHEVVVLGGVAVKVKVAHMRLCHSRMMFIRAYPREAQEMVFDAHDRGFAFFRGACQRGIYDNMKTAVETVFVGRARDYNRRFLQMCAHYLVEPQACTPAAGWEKGQVESQVKYARGRVFSPRLKFRDYEELNGWLVDRCIQLARTHAHPDVPEKTVWEMFLAERAALVPYAGSFDGFHARMASVTKTCLVRFDNNRYSVSSSAVGRPVELRAYAGRIEIRQDGRTVGVHARSFERDRTVYDPWHYIGVLERKPGALRNGAPFRDWILPVSIERIRRRLADRPGGDRQVVRLLVAVNEHGLTCVDRDCVEFCAVALFQAIGKRSSNMMASWHLTAYHSLTERFHSEEVALSAR
ncbi:Integrase, catalytic region (plasmid) [Komagataeibacter xylinus E25]|nr:Integrase, catalytic region [Komagataeibacter xylinus E25]